MMDNQEAAALLIKNIGMFEQATLLLTEIGEKVDNAVNQKINDWCRNSHDEWLFIEEDKLFTHKSCVRKTEEGEERIANFGLWTQTEAKDHWWLASYCGKGEDCWGIFFEFNIGALGVKEAKLRKYLQQENEKHPKLREIGFEFQGKGAGSWFLPFKKLDADKLASAYAEDAVADALDPIEDALNKVKEAWPEFKLLVDATAKKYSNSES